MDAAQFLPEVDEADWTLDEVALALQQLRVHSGNVSYSELAKRVTSQRVAAGVEAKRATVARSTIYDCFRTGRVRVNHDLVAEIVLALTDDPQQAEQWRSRCLHAHYEARPAAIIAMEVSQEPAVEADERLLDTADEPLTIVKSVATTVVEPAPPTVVEPPAEPIQQPVLAHQPEPTHQPQTRLGLRRRLLGSHTPTAVVAVFALSLLINLIAPRMAIQMFGPAFPLFFDMIGTALAAFLLGPWWAAAVALVTMIPSGFLPFLAVNIVGALVWGYGVRQLRMARSLPHFILLNCLVALICTAVASFVISVVFGGQQMLATAQAMVDSAVALGIPTTIATVAANLTISVADKMLSGFVALGIAGTALRKYAPPQLKALTAPIAMVPARLYHRFDALTTLVPAMK